LACSLFDCLPRGSEDRIDDEIHRAHGRGIEECFDGDGQQVGCVPLSVFRTGGLRAALQFTNARTCRSGSAPLCGLPRTYHHSPRLHAQDALGEKEKAPPGLEEEPDGARDASSRVGGGWGPTRACRQTGDQPGRNTPSVAWTMPFEASTSAFTTLVWRPAASVITISSSIAMAVSVPPWTVSSVAEPPP